MPEADFDAVAEKVSETGLMVRGGFHIEAADRVPALAGGRTPATLLVVGNAGPDMWTAFESAPEFATRPDPLDRWSARVLTSLAEALGAGALFPFTGPPYHPFQRWAQRAEPVWPSPIGTLIHPRFGLWHAYRGALTFAARLALPPREAADNPCETCRDKPCLNTCPVGAFAQAGYDVPACAGHVGSPAGRDCLESGCRARRACPVGRAWHYPGGQAALHMRSFLDGVRQGGGHD